MAAAVSMMTCVQLGQRLEEQKVLSRAQRGQRRPKEGAGERAPWQNMGAEERVLHGKKAHAHGIPLLRPRGWRLPQLLPTVVLQASQAIAPWVLVRTRLWQLRPLREHLRVRPSLPCSVALLLSPLASLVT